MAELRLTTDDQAARLLETDAGPPAAFMDCMKSSAVRLQVITATGFGALGGYYIFKMSPWNKYAKAMSVYCGVVGWFTSKVSNARACMLKAQLELEGRVRNKDTRQQDEHGRVEETPVEDYTVDLFEPDEPKSSTPLDELSEETGEKEQPKQGTSYAQLRQHNREHAYKAELQRMMRNAGKLGETTQSSSTTNDFNRFASDRPAEKPLNKYGDAFE